MPTAFKKGQIVRYGPGPTTLCRLTEPRAGGWSGEGFDGRAVAVAHAHMMAATTPEIKSYVEEARRRRAK